MRSSPSRKIRWSEEEIETVRTMYHHSPRYLILAALPKRNWGQVVDMAHRFDLTRHKEVRMGREERLKRKREGMQRQRQKPGQREVINERHRKRYAADPTIREKASALSAEWRQARFFHYRSGRYRLITAKDLARLWKSQRGKCALTGRKLGRDAHLDHIVPLARGGLSVLSNFQWLSPEANYAKRHMHTDEFVSLCQEVTAWIGQRIAISGAAR